VKAAGHDAVGSVESFFDAIAVVAVYINVKHARESPEELEDAEDNIIDVAEP
jgi:hypothetical protein